VVNGVAGDNEESMARGEIQKLALDGARLLSGPSEKGGSVLVSTIAESSELYNSMLLSLNLPQQFFHKHTRLFFFVCQEQERCLCKSFHTTYDYEV